MFFFDKCISIKAAEQIVNPIVFTANFRGLEINLNKT